MRDISQTIQADGQDIAIVTVDGDFGTITLEGHLDGSLKVTGSGNVHAIRTGVGNGHAHRDGIGYGDAIREGSGHGYAIRTGGGDGYATRTDSGDGDARRAGDGDGSAYRDGSGHGDAIREGSGDGDARREGSGYGDAIRDGSGHGRALSESNARRLTSPTSGSPLLLYVQQGTVVCGCFIGTLDELTDPARDDLPPDHWAHKLTAGNLGTITQEELEA